MYEVGAWARIIQPLPAFGKPLGLALKLWNQSGRKKLGMLHLLPWAVLLLAIAGFVWRQGRVKANTSALEAFLLRFQTVLAVEHPEVEFLGLTCDGAKLVLRFRHQELALPLSDFLLLERALPGSFSDSLKRVFEQLPMFLSRVDDLLFDEAIPLLLPQIRSKQWILENSPSLGCGRVLTKELLDDLVICYVLDGPESMIFISDGHLRSWGCRPAYIHNLAMSNLKTLAGTNGGLPLIDPRQAGARILHSNDGYDAARLLLALEPNMEEEDLVFAVPDRDLLIVGKKSDNLAELMKDVGHEYASSRHPISPCLFRVRSSRLIKIDSNEHAG